MLFIEMMRTPSLQVKQVIHPHLRVHNAAMCVLPDAVGGDHDQLQGFSRFCGFTEHLHLFFEVFLVVVVDCIFSYGELDLANIRCSVTTVNDEVDLGFPAFRGTAP